MPWFVPIALPIIEAAVAVGGTVLSAEQASKTSKAQQKQYADQLAAYKAAQLKSSAPPPELPKTAANFPDVASQIAAAYAQKQNQVGEAGVSPGFYTSALQSEFPGFDQMIGNIVTGGRP